MPITYITFLIASIANAGIFPLAGFWSKDEILVGSWLEHYEWVTVIGFIAAFFTSLYMFRVVFMTFWGEERFDTNEIHPHESPPVMTWPLIALAVPTVFVGVAAGWPPEAGWIHDFLEPNFHHEEAEDHALREASVVVTYASPDSFNQVEGEEVGEEEGHHVSNTLLWTFGILSTIVALAGAGVAYLAYVVKSPIFSPEVWAKRIGGLYQFIYRKWMFDELYEMLIVHPLYLFSRFLWRIVDVRIIDGAVNGVAGGVGFTSSRLRRVQTGFVANYALAIALGAVIIVGAYFVFESNLFT
jgi:NADH-quinone oxidoreductase subunit L